MGNVFAAHPLIQNTRMGCAGGGALHPQSGVWLKLKLTLIYITNNICTVQDLMGICGIYLISLLQELIAIPVRLFLLTRGPWVFEENTLAPALVCRCLLSS